MKTRETPLSQQSDPPKSTRMTGGMLLGLIILISASILLLKFSLPKGRRPPRGGATPAVSPTPPRSGDQTSFCRGGSTVGCQSLGALWMSGKATCRSNGEGYDVSSCVAVKGKGELVKPAERDTRWSQARCNDGTPFAFDVELSPSRGSDWVIYLKGGGFCDDEAFDCRERSREKTAIPLTTTPPRPDKTVTAFIKNDGIFSRNRSANPTFSDANFVYAIYCSSDAWSGTATERRPTSADSKGWYFSGKPNVEAMIESLVGLYGLTDGSKTKILFAGGSGGGHGVGVNIDTFFTYVPNTANSGRLFLLNDAGSQIDFDDPSYRPGDANVPMRDLWKKAYAFWGSAGNRRCEEAFKKEGKDSSACSFAPANYQFIQSPAPRGYGVPVLIQESSIDGDFLRWHNIDARNPKDSAVLGRYRDLTLASFPDARWIFSGGDHPYHTILDKSGTDGWDMGPSGKTFKEVLMRFWQGSSGERVIFGNP
ncbi:MAG: pectin acetylesterase-family hydrolase [bacterium]|nr:pectin acetylesterase-family hydrolase [bacterium]